MPFLAEARHRLAGLPAGGDKYRILDHLIANAQGAANTKSWPAIMMALAPIIKKEDFQQGLLGLGRSSPDFIGSCGNGYFIILTQADVDAAGEFLAQRVRQIVRHHDELGNQAVGHGLNRPPPV